MRLRDRPARAALGLLLLVLAACGTTTQLERSRDVALALLGEGKLPEGISIGLVRSGRSTGTAVTIEPGAHARIALEPGPEPVLETSVSIPDGGTRAVTFVVEVERAGTVTEVARRTIDAGAAGWQRWTVPLGEPGPLVLRLATEGGAGAWTMPRVRSRGRMGPAPSRREAAMLLSLDTLRVDRLGAYGHDGVLSPHLDAILRHSRMHPEAMSTSHWTLAAHASMLTGMPADVHGAGRKNAGVPDVPMLSELFAGAGWETAAFVHDVAWLGPRFRMNRGFRIHLDTLERTADRIRRVRDYLESSRAPRLFVFVHLFDAHSDVHYPYEATPEALALCAPAASELEPCVETRCGSAMLGDLVKKMGRLPRRPERALRQRYEAGILDLDHEVGRLAAELRGVDFFRHGVLALVSDHGEELGDHGSYLHPRLQPEITRALLAFRMPGGEGSIERGVPSVADVAPTLAARFGLPLPPTFEMSHDLASTTPRAAYTWSGSGEASLRTEERAAFRAADGTFTVFDLVADPYQHHPAPAAEDDPLRRELAALIARHAAEYAKLDHEVALAGSEEDDDRLRALGYVR